MAKSDHVCAEIMYLRANLENVHSDICGDLNSADWREFLHKALDEWLDNGNGSGIFYVGDPNYNND
jgi:hypothetical protein